MRRIHKILVGIVPQARKGELTPGSRNALTQASWLAERVGAELILLHSTWSEDRPAADPPGDSPGDSAGDATGDPTGGEAEPRLGEEACALLDSIVDEHTARGVPCRLVVTSERPWLAITHGVLRGEADLVVVGKREEVSGEGGRRLGTQAVKLLRKCPSPVWVVKPEHDLVHKLVLAATDLTPVGDLAVEHGAFVAAKHACTLHGVHAYSLPMSLQLAAGRMDEQEYEEALDQIKSTAQSHIDRVIDSCGFDGESAVHIGRNAPFLAIREAVEHLHPDLLVMGTVSQGGFAGFLVGNTAERLLDRVDCSILTVKPADFVCPLAMP
ncbi:MAG: universal stress protein [Planctomycetota bacterium]